MGRQLRQGFCHRSEQGHLSLQVEYTLGLFSGFAGTVYFTSALNTASRGSQQAIFGSTRQIDPLINGGKALRKGAAGNYVSGNPLAAGGAIISFDDRGGGNDADFQDFSVRAEAVPEPFPWGASPWPVRA
jgi:hypothetical protein